MDLQQGLIPCFFLAMKEFQKDLIDWYIHNHRPLEFRLNKDPYEIWISEIMAQQTRIEAMLPYFKRWIQQLPDIESVAKCDDEKLNKLWQGLGYYLRCKNIKKCAIECVEKYNGKLPCTKEELLKLPGIGPYTAGAIASIANGQRVSAVDGNVIRVFSRLYNIFEDVTKTSVKKQIEMLVDESLPSKEEISYYNQAIMELGALICIPKNPRCELCPVKEYCDAKDPGSLPYKAKKKARKIEYKHLYILVHKDKQQGNCYDNDAESCGKMIIRADFSHKLRINQYWKGSEAFAYQHRCTKITEYAHKHQQCSCEQGRHNQRQNYFDDSLKSVQSQTFGSLIQ